MKGYTTSQDASLEHGKGGGGRASECVRTMASQEGSRGISRACRGSRAGAWGVRGGGGREGRPATAGDRAKQGLLDDIQAASQMLHLLLRLPPPVPHE